MGQEVRQGDCSFDRGQCGQRPQLGSEQGCLVLESVPLTMLPCPHPEGQEVGLDRNFPLDVIPLSMVLCPLDRAVSLPSCLGPLNPVSCITNGVLALGRHRMMGHNSMARSHGFLVDCTFSNTGLKYEAWHPSPRLRSHGGLGQAKGDLCALGDFPASWDLPKARAVTLLPDAYVPGSRSVC